MRNQVGKIELLKKEHRIIRVTDTRFWFHALIPMSFLSLFSSAPFLFLT